MSAKERGIAVFGSSGPAPGDALYEQARELGELLASAGYLVVTGGYGGVMEAASRGAVEAGGRALGIPCDIFSAREPNEYLTDMFQCRDLHERVRELVDHARGFVVLEGQAGTLCELFFLWALHRAGCLEGRAVVLLGGRWKEFLSYLELNRMLQPPQLAICEVVETPKEALDTLAAKTKPGKSSA